MLLFPYTKLTIYSNLNGNILVERLKESVEPYAGFRFDNYSKSPKPFVGKLNERTFDIRPVYEGRNSFIPYVHGKIEEHGSASKVVLTMRLHYIVALFLLWIFGLVVYSVVKYQETAALIVILVVYSMTIGFFNLEYRKTKKALTKLLQAQTDMVSQ